MGENHWSAADIYKTSYDHAMACIEALVNGKAEIDRNEDGRVTAIHWPSPFGNCKESILWPEKEETQTGFTRADQRRLQKLKSSAREALD